MTVGVIVEAGRTGVIAVVLASHQVPYLVGKYVRAGCVLPLDDTKGVVGKDSGPFAIDTLSVPYANPWNALMFTSGHDFLPDGSAATT